MLVGTLRIGLLIRHVPQLANSITLDFAGMIASLKPVC
jgi:hypothetical protein